MAPFPPLSEFVSLVARRGGETTIDHMPYGKAGRAKIEQRPLAVVDRAVLTGAFPLFGPRAYDPKDVGRELVLLRAEGWRYYSRRFGARPAALAYLCGADDNGPWAVRVPGPCETVASAIRYTTPAAVVQAVAAGRRVRRQGDLFVVESTTVDRAATDLAASGARSHAIKSDGERRLLIHTAAPTEDRCSRHPGEAPGHIAFDKKGESRVMPPSSGVFDYIYCRAPARRAKPHRPVVLFPKSRIYRCHRLTTGRGGARD